MVVGLPCPALGDPRRGALQLEHLRALRVDGGAGHNDRQRLLHLRRADGHLLGCWALDLALGKR